MVTSAKSCVRNISQNFNPCRTVLIWAHIKPQGGTCRAILSLLKTRTYDQHRASTVAHYNDVIMGTIASQITSLTIVYSTFYSDADHKKHQSSASLAFVRGLHRGPVNSPHKWPVTLKMFPFDDVIMNIKQWCALGVLLCSYDAMLLFLRSLLNSFWNDTVMKMIDVYIVIQCIIRRRHGQRKVWTSHRFVLLLCRWILGAWLLRGIETSSALLAFLWRNHRSR